MCVYVYIWGGVCLCLYPPPSFYPQEPGSMSISLSLYESVCVSVFVCASVPIFVSMSIFGEDVLCLCLWMCLCLCPVFMSVFMVVSVSMSVYEEKAKSWPRLLIPCPLPATDRFNQTPLPT